MARANLLTTNFTGGELAPELALGRVDIAKYNNGARRLENVTIAVQGGVKRRPGTRYIAPTKYEHATSRLIEFVFNRGQAYVLEMGEGYLRFLKDRVQLWSGAGPVEVASPYTQAHLPSANYVQKADTAFFAHEAVYPYRLQRFADTQWSFSPVPFITPPFEEQGHNPLADLTLGQAQPGATVANASAPAFFASDVGRNLSYAGGVATITAHHGPTSISLTIATPFPGLNLPAGAWNMDGSPRDDLAPANVGRVGQLVSLNADFTHFEPDKTLTGFIGGAGVAIITVVGHDYDVGDTVQVTTIPAGGGVVGVFTGVVSEVQSPDVFVIATPQVYGGLSVAGSARRMLISQGSQVWRAEDVNKFVSINGGLVRITHILSPSTANGEVLRAMSSAVPAGPNAWILQSAAWNGQKGFPRAVSINTQRLLFAGSPGYPQHVWASAVQEYLNFGFGTADDEAFRFELDGPRNSPIRHIAPARRLLVLTEADEMSLKGGTDKPITPTNIDKTDESTVGASAVRPVKIGSEIVFTQAAGKKVHAVGYRFEIDGFSAPDRTVFASHVTMAGVVQLAHQKEPDPTLFAVRADGQLAVCAYDVEQEVTGWARWITAGAFESIASVPTPIGEDAYTIVRRSVGGATRRYIEVFDADMMVDCGISGTHPTGQATWGGLGHLEGEAVVAMADGAYLGEYRVAGGEVTLTRPARSVQIGLPFLPLVEMLPPDSQGSQVHCNEVVIRVLNTTSAAVNGQPIDFRRFGSELLDRPPPEYTGDQRLTTLSDEIFVTKQVITQPLPLPFHLLNVIRRVTINEGQS